MLYNCEHHDEPLINKFVSKGDIMCITAKPKIGKTVLIQQIIFNLTTGEPFLGIYEVNKKCKVLYCQGEGKRHAMIKRIQNMSKEINFDDENFFHINIRGIGLHTDKGLNKMNELAMKGLDDGRMYDVIVIDPLYKFMNGGSMNSEKDVIAWTSNVDKFIGNFNATGIIIHHDTEKSYRDKDGKMYGTPDTNLFGSTFWSSFFSHTFKLKKEGDMHVLVAGIQRDGSMIDRQPMYMVVPQDDDNGRLFFTTREMDKKVSLNEFTLVEFLKKHGKYIYPKIYKECDLGQSCFYYAINRLMKKGLVSKTKDDKGKVWYGWIGAKENSQSV